MTSFHSLVLCGLACINPLHSKYEKGEDIPHNPTELFTVLVPQNLLLGRSYAVQKRRPKDFHAAKSRNFCRAREELVR